MTYDPEIHIAFILRGIGVSPDDITAVIGIAPTRQWRLNDLIGKSQLRRKQDGWALQLAPVESLDIETSICELLDIVEPLISKIDIATERYSLKREISCAVYIHNQTPACSISINTIKRIALTKANFDLDIILFERK
jgi:hypothetical protein